MENAIWIILLVISVSPGTRSEAVSMPHEELRFRHLSVEDGLPDARVHCIIQDRQGFMWFGSHGLCKYDGYRIKVYKPKIPDVGAMNYDVRTIHEDQEGILWVGTFETGLARFDPLTEQFTIFRHDPDDPNSLSNPAATTICEDRDGVLWIGTPWDGLNRFDRATGAFTRYAHDGQDPHSLSGRIVTSILEDRDGRLWVGTDRGLNLMDRSSGRFTRFQHDPEDPNSLSHNRLSQTLWQDGDGLLWMGTGDVINRLDPRVGTFSRFPLDPNNAVPSNNRMSAVCEDQSGQIWIGTQGGLWKWDPMRKVLHHFQHDPADPHSLSDNRIHDIRQDRSGLMWVATNSGVDRFDPEPSPLTVYRNDAGNVESLSSNAVSAISEDHEGNLLIAMTGGGLDRFDRTSGEWAHIKHLPGDPNSLSASYLTAVHASQVEQGVIWLGTGRAGLDRFDGAIGRFTHLRHDPNDRNSLRDNRINCLLEDREGILWIGTWTGLHWLNQTTGQMGHYPADPWDPDLPRPVHVRALHDDRLGNLWVGTYRGGLYRLDRASQEFSRYVSDPNDPQSLSHDHVRTIYEDSRGMLWVGTRDGLSRFDHTTDTFTRFLGVNYPVGEEAWQSYNDIRGILEDAAGNLWLSTARGIYVLTDISESGFRTRHYESLAGQWLGGFNGNVCLKSHRGDLLFGSNRGLYAFHPDRMRDSDPPSVVLTDLKLSSESVPIATDGSTPLVRHVSASEEIRVRSDMEVLTIEFAALDFVDPKRNQYAYMLEGLTDDWVHQGNQRSVTLTKLDPGDYVLRVKAANSDGVWNEAGTSVRLVITPSWWETIWFRVLAVGLVIGGVAAEYRRRVGLVAARQRVLEAKVIERTGELQIAQDDLVKTRDSLASEVESRTAELQQEVAERKQTEQRLTVSDERFRALMRNSIEAMWCFEIDPPMSLDLTIDEQLDYLYSHARVAEANTAWAKYAGYDCAEDMIGLDLEACVPRSVPENVAVIEEIAKSGYHLNGFTTYEVTRQGEKRVVRNNHTGVIKDGYLVRTWGTALDVTEQEADQEKLSQAEQKYRTVADFTHDWEYWEGPDGRLIYVSPSCERITGYGPEEFLKNRCSVDALVLPDDRRTWDHHRCATTEDERQKGIQFRIRTRAGEIRWIEHVCQPVFDDRGRSLGRRASNRDITSRRQAEDESRRLRAELAHMDRVTMTGTLTAAIAHEINQPLAAVLSNAQAALRLLRQKSPDLDEVREALCDIVSDDKRAAEVIRRLRTLLKKESTNPEPVDVNAVAAEVISLVHSEAVMRNVSLTTDLTEDTPRVVGDRVQVQQVILNLLINAMDAVRGQSPGDRRVILASRRQGNDALEISVTDSGPGVDPNDMERIFDPFHTTKSGGMGMGLAICRSIVEKHGGRLWAENAPGGGARLSFTLPVR